MIGCMTVIKINAITVPADGGDELARRFAARAGAVDNQAGFGHGHRSAAERAGDQAPTRPVGVHSELWSYEIAGGSAGAAG